MSNLPNTVDPTSGKITITAPPPNHPGFMQNITGGLIDAAAAKTSASIAEQASHAKAFGVTMRGSGRSKRRFSMKGGGADANMPILPEAHSIPGVSHTSVHMNAMNTLNQLKADGVYDNLANATPYKVGGFRFRGDEQVGTSRQKRTHKGKKHGRPSKRRTYRRNSRRNAHRTRGRNRSHK
jgi:hypothetical protein